MRDSKVKEETEMNEEDEKSQKYERKTGVN